MTLESKTDELLFSVESAREFFFLLFTPLSYTKYGNFYTDVIRQARYKLRENQLITFKITIFCLVNDIWIKMNDYQCLFIVAINRQQKGSNTAVVSAFLIFLTIEGKLERKLKDYASFFYVGKSEWGNE